MSQSNDNLDPRLNKMLDDLRSVPPRDPAAAARGRVLFLSQANNLKQAVSKLPERRHTGWFSSVLMVLQQKEYKPMFTTLLSALIIVVLALGGTTATAYAAQDDLPGDMLYGVKTFTEDVRLAFASDAQDVNLCEEFTQRRMQETVQLAENGRYDDVATAMQRYELQLGQMNQSLVRLASKDPAHADALAARIQIVLQTQLDTLTQLRTRVSDTARASIDEAVKHSREHAGIKFVGLVETIDASSWVVAGRNVAITAQTEIKGSPAVGSLVEVHAYTAPDGSLTAREIELVETDDQSFDFSGFVDGISDASWTINGQMIIVTADTEIRGTIAVGDWVVVKAVLDANGGLKALLIHLPGYDGAPGNGSGDESGERNRNRDGEDGNSGSGNGNDDPGTGEGNSYPGNGNDDPGTGEGNSDPDRGDDSNRKGND